MQDNPSLDGRLFHIELMSPNPEALAQFYSELYALPLRQRGNEFICGDAQRVLLFSRGPAGTLRNGGYAVANEASLEALKARLAAHAIACEPADPDLYQTGAVALRDPDGNRISFGLPQREAIAASGPLPGRLQHLVVGSTDAQRMVDFYANVIGMRISDRVLDEEGGLRTCFLRTDHEHHSFAVFQTSECRLDHHCYELNEWNDIRDWGDRLAARRIFVKWGPGRHGPGNNLFLFFHDPDGNWVELSAELERVSEERPIGNWPHEERTLNSWGQGLLRS